MKIGNSGSKYDLEPDEFDKDVKDKLETIENFVMEIVRVMCKDVRYRDNIPISSEQRKICMAEAHKRVYDKLQEGLNEYE